MEIPEHQRPCNAECRKLPDAIDAQLTAYNAGRAAALADVERFNAAGKVIARELRKLEAVALAPLPKRRVYRGGESCPMCSEYPIDIDFEVHELPTRPAVERPMGPCDYCGSPFHDRFRCPKR